MAEPLPPIPPLPANPFWRDSFDHAVAHQRHADVTAQTDAILAQNAQQAIIGAAMTRATDLQEANYMPTRADRWWQALMCQFGADESGLMRRDQGVGNMATWADQAVAEFESRFPDTTPA